MPTFLVRIIETHDLVGIFVAQNIHRLAILIDECTDPGDCEFLRLPAGGVMWTSPAVPIPIERSDDNDDLGDPDPVPWARATLTESWWSGFHGYIDDDWIPLFPEDPKPPPPVPPTPRPAGPGQVVLFKKRKPRF
jgi:hypothetical protein